MILKIMPEFRDLIAPLTDAEFEQLEKNILAEGCWTRIATWKQFILDGHCCHKICIKHGIPFETVEMKFKTRHDAKVWAANNQLGRRNLAPFRMIELASVVHAHLKDIAAENQYNGGRYKSAPDQAINFREAVADAAGTSQDTVRKFQRIIKVATPETIDKLRSGDMKIGTAYRLYVEERTQKNIIDVMKDTDQDGIPLSYGILMKKINEADKVCDARFSSLDFYPEPAKSKAVFNNLERISCDIDDLIKAVKALPPFQPATI